MKTLHSQWKNQKVQSVELSKLTPMDIHRDDRYLTRDLPRIQQQGLWYPLLVYYIDPNWWNNVFVKHRSAQCRWDEPTVVDDKIWAVKMGSNRYQCAKHLGYDAVDVIICEDANCCVKLGKWFAQCDPLNTSMPYKGLFDYGHLL